MAARQAESLFVQDTLVPRRLLPLLDPLERGRVAVISAPAGFGKTQLVRAWADQSRDRVERLRNVIIFRGQETFDTSRFHEAITRAAADPRPVYFFFDNHDQVQDPSFITEVLDVAERNQQVRLVFSGRTRPPVPLSGLAVRGLLVDIDAATLALTREEVAELVERHGPVAESALDYLMEEFQGWPLAIDLVSRHRLTWDSLPLLTHVVDGYLEEEVLHSVTAEERQLLEDLSPLPELTPASAAHLSGRSDATAQLALLAAKGIPMRWSSLNTIRLNPALRHHLSRGLAEREPERGIRQSRRAATWLDREGQPADAIRHAATAHDPEMVYDLFTNQIAVKMLDDPAGLTQLLEELATSIPPDVQALTRLALLALAQPGTTPPSTLRSIHASIGADATPAYVARFYAVALLVLRQRSYHGGEWLLEEIGRFMDERSHELGPTDEAMLTLEWGFYLYQFDHLRPAIGMFERAISAAHIAGIRWAAELALSLQAWVLLFLGGTHQLRRSAEEALLSADRRGHAHKGTVAYSVLALLGAAFDLGDTVEAERQLERYRALDGDPEETEVCAVMLEASIRVVQGQPDRALVLLENQLRATPTQPPFILMTLLSHRFNAHLAKGALPQAEDALREIEALPLDASTTLLPIYRSRLLLARGQAQRAFDLLDATLAETAAPIHTRPKHLLHAQMMLGIAASDLGRNEEALMSFQRAGVLAQSLGLDAPSARHTALATSLHRDHVELTTMESRVMAQLCTDRSLAEISASLFISPNTLKTHLRRIYRKLGVSGRKAAVERVRVLGMRLDAG